MRRCLLLALAGFAFAWAGQAQTTPPTVSPVQRRIEAAQKRIHTDPKSAQGYNELAFALCRLARDNGDAQLYDKADASLRRSLELSPGSFEARKLQVVVLLGKQKPEEALKIATDLNSHNHDDIGIWGLLVDCNVALKKLDEAERDAQWILDLRSGSSLGFTKAAGLRELFGDPEGAIEFYEEAARRTSPSDADERAWLMTQNARLQLKSGNGAKAQALITEALKLFPDSRLALAVLAGSNSNASQKTDGAALSSIGNREAINLSQLSTDERIQAYERLLAAAPNDAQARAGLISTYLQKLRESADYHYLDLASKLVDQMLEKDGGSFIALRFQNEIDLQRHDFRSVAERAQDMAKYSPSDAGTWGNLGDALMELGEYERAGQAYLKMFALGPNLASYNRLAYFKFVTGDAPRAIELMKEAIAASDVRPETVAWCWAELGDMYFKTGQLDHATRAYSAAVGLFPKLHRALAGLGRVEAAQGRLNEAINSYLRAQSVVPLVEYASALEDLYAATGQSKKAGEQAALIETIEKIGKATNEKTNRNLALALADHDEHLEVAQELMETELPNRSDVYTYDALGWVLFKSGKLEQATEASNKAVRMHTPEPLFYYHASKIAAARGDEETMRSYSDHLLALNPKFDVAKK
jgi:tetratricopeptide (TPR) repeat protein